MTLPNCVWIHSFLHRHRFQTSFYAPDWLHRASWGIMWEKTAVGHETMIAPSWRLGFSCFLVPEPEPAKSNLPHSECFEIYISCILLCSSITNKMNWTLNCVEQPSEYQVEQHDVVSVTPWTEGRGWETLVPWSSNTSIYFILSFRKLRPKHMQRIWSKAHFGHYI